MCCCGGGGGGDGGGVLRPGLLNYGICPTWKMTFVCWCALVHDVVLSNNYVVPLGALCVCSKIVALSCQQYMLLIALGHVCAPKPLLCRVNDFQH